MSFGATLASNRDKKVPWHLFSSAASLTGDKTDIYNATVDGEDTMLAVVLCDALDLSRISWVMKFIDR